MVQLINTPVKRFFFCDLLVDVAGVPRDIVAVFLVAFAAGAAGPDHEEFLI